MCKKYRVIKKNVYSPGCMQHHSTAGFLVRTARSNTAERSVLTFHSVQRVVTVSEQLSALPSSINWSYWAGDGAGGAGSGSRQIDERLSQVQVQAFMWIPTI